MKVITFSSVFPKNHPREGKPTFFVDQIMLQLGYNINTMPEAVRPLINDFYVLDGSSFKKHTIRAGNRWKAGNAISARVWSGAPYRSKQIEFAQLTIKKLWQFEISESDYWINGCPLGFDALTKVAANDGLSRDDFESWFAIHPKKNQKSFKGQIICWDENLTYKF